MRWEKVLGGEKLEGVWEGEGEMEKRLLEEDKCCEEAETQVNEAIEDRSLVEELCADSQWEGTESGVWPSNLPTAKEGVRAYLEPEGGSCKRVAFSPTAVTSYHYSLQGILDSLYQQVQWDGQVSGHTKALNEVIANHKLDFIGYDGYDTESIRGADDDLMRAVYDAPLFLFLDSLRTFD